LSLQSAIRLINANEGEGKGAGFNCEDTSLSALRATAAGSPPLRSETLGPPPAHLGLRGTSRMKNIVLIGMPGVGKSTIGVILAKAVSKDFIDTDLLIQRRHRLTLQNIIDRYGYLALRQFEEAVILSLAVRDTVIATGGSAVYSEVAMKHLKSTGQIVYLKLHMKGLLERIDNYATRGIARPPTQTFSSLFGERTRLYKRYSDVIVDCKSKTHEEIVQEIVNKRPR
jgi:shikimate kinase